MRARSPLTQTRCTVNTEGLFGKRGEVEGINAEKMVPTKSEGKVNMKDEAEGQGTVFGPLESATSNTPIVAQKFEVARVAPTMLANETEGALSGPGDIRATWPHALFFYVSVVVARPFALSFRHIIAVIIACFSLLRIGPGFCRARTRLG